MSARSSRGAYVGLGLLGLALTVPALVAREDDKPRKVRATVVVILATEADDGVDKQLECIAREVRKSHPKLRGFRMVTPLASKSLTVGQPEKFDLVEEQTTCITVLRATGKMERVRLKVGPPRMGEITYSTPCGKFLTFVTPHKTKAGESVLVAVRVQPCGGK